MQLLTTLAVALFAMVLGISPAASQAVQELLNAARNLAAQRSYDPALAAVKAALRHEPGNFSALYDAVRISQAAGRSVEMGAHLETLKPRLTEAEKFGLLQAQAETYYHGRQQTELDRTRRDITSLWRSTADPRIKNEKAFVRDNIFVEGKGVILAMEAFELGGPRAVRYVFRFIQKDQKERSVSLGSYEFTTKALQEIQNRPAGWRAWHLDAYEPGGVHSTLGMWMDGEPSFDTARASAIAYFKGELRPSSTSNFGTR